MTLKPIPRDVAEQVLSMGRVEWGRTDEFTEAGHLEHLRESLRITREHFNLEDVPVAMHGLYLEGTETVLCHTGTSPNSGANAQALAGAWNWLVEQCGAQSDESRPLDGDVVEASDCVRRFLELRKRIVGTGPDELKLIAALETLLSTATRSGDGELREALKDAREAVASLPDDALGMGEVIDTYSGEPIHQYPIRDELLSKIDAALSSSGDRL